MTIFEQANELCDIIRVVEYYGVQVKRGKALCPFHNEKTPSMSFKNNRYRCFGCGAGGDCVDFVSRLHNIAPIEAVRRLNTDFSLGLDLDKPVDNKTVKRHRRQQELYEVFNSLENSTYNILCDKLHLLRDTIANSIPLSVEWCAAVRAKELTEYYIDILTDDSFEDKYSLLMQIKDGEKKIEQKRDKGRTGTAVAG